MFYELIIKKADGFGTFEVLKSDEGCADVHDILRAIYQNDAYEEIYNLAKDDLPAYVEDIRGQVRNEPLRIFAVVTTEHGEKTVRYLGVTGEDD